MRSIGTHHATIAILVGVGTGCIDVGELRPSSDAGAMPGAATAVAALSVALGDLNGDGKEDVAVVDNRTRQAKVVLGTGGDTFVTQASSQWPPSVTFADLNADGTIDLAVSKLDGDGHGALYVLLNTAEGAFAAPVRSPLPDRGRVTVPLALSVEPSRIDGRQDLAIVGLERIHVLTNLGDGRFVPVAAGRPEDPATAAVAATCPGCAFDPGAAAPTAAP